VTRLAKTCWLALAAVGVIWSVTAAETGRLVGDADHLWLITSEDGFYQLAVKRSGAPWAPLPGEASGPVVAATASTLQEADVIRSVLQSAGISPKPDLCRNQHWPDGSGDTIVDDLFPGLGWNRMVK